MNEYIKYLAYKVHVYSQMLMTSLDKSLYTCIILNPYNSRYQKEYKVEKKQQKTTPTTTTKEHTSCPPPPPLRGKKV